MKNFFSLLFLAFLITGCSSIPQQSFDAKQKKKIKSIALLEPPASNRIKVRILRHPAAAFGLIGATIAAADTDGKTSAYSEALGENKINWAVYSRQHLKNKLEDSGYTVTVISARPQGDRKQAFLEKYPKTNTDAIFDYFYAVQHVATRATTNYIPTVTLFSRMVSSADNSVLYAQHFTIGNPAVAAKGAVVVAKKTGYKNIAALNAKPQESIGALKQGVEKITDLIAKDLKK